MASFAEWFREITGNRPFPYQEQLALSLNSIVFLNVPTGAGKTAAIILAWLWCLFYAEESVRKKTPRRLIYCLPMRTLVEQTYAEVEKWLDQADLPVEVTVHQLMGGAVSQDWDGDPNQACILIGTQDQLLSRALNRGYSMSRYRWPIHFALMNNDCLWVMDETQLMGAGLRTTAQLQGLREKLKTYGPVRSLWMSATLDPDLLKTVDHTPDENAQITLSDQDRSNGNLSQRLTAKKQLSKAVTPCDKDEKAYAKSLAQEIVERHHAGSLTLVICNRVSRAQELYKTLRSQVEDELLLIHSRFRPADRTEKNDKLRDRNLTGIVVATQAIEAGVDISARVLFTELAPWPSLVQRFGRCNRYGEQPNAQVYWIDILNLDKKGVAAPYEADELERSREELIQLEDVGLDTLKQVEVKPPEPEGLIPRRRDLLELFDTSVDLAGHNIDVSPFIRETDDNDVAIAWRNWDNNSTPKGQPPDDTKSLQRDELCRVTIPRVQELLKKLAKQTPKRYAWTWDRLQGQWTQAQSVYPGMMLLLHCSDGGYSDERGFTGNPKDQPNEVERDEPLGVPDQDDRDPLTEIGQFVTLRQHSQDVAEAVQSLCDPPNEKAVPPLDPLKKLLEVDSDRRPELLSLLARSGRWHDAGKNHDYFQKLLTYKRPDRETGGPWAKSDHNYRNPDDRNPKRDRKGFRHELVSALAALQQDEDFLLCYLVACHHGKVRMTIQPRPTEKASKDKNAERFALGVREGDEIKSADLGDGLVMQEHKLSLSCMELGNENGSSWTAQALELLDEFGPFKLAFLETIIRLADWQVSKGYNQEVTHE